MKSLRMRCQESSRCAGKAEHVAHIRSTGQYLYELECQAPPAVVYEHLWELPIFQGMWEADAKDVER